MWHAAHTVCIAAASRWTACEGATRDGGDLDLPHGSAGVCYWRIGSRPVLRHRCATAPSGVSGVTWRHKSFSPLLRENQHGRPRVPTRPGCDACRGSTR